MQGLLYKSLIHVYMFYYIHTKKKDLYINKEAKYRKKKGKQILDKHKHTIYMLKSKYINIKHIMHAFK